MRTIESDGAAEVGKNSSGSAGKAGTAMPVTAVSPSATTSPLSSVPRGGSSFTAPGKQNSFCFCTAGAVAARGSGRKFSSPPHPRGKRFLPGSAQTALGASGVVSLASILLLVFPSVVFA